MAAPLHIKVQRFATTSQPEHHIVEAEASSGWKTYLSSWITAPRDLPSRRNSSSNDKPRSFRNPWPSWHIPTQVEIRKALEWGEDRDPCITLGKTRIKDDDRVKTGIHTTLSNEEASAKLLQVTQPDFTLSANQKAKVTWLGHAGVLLQLPPMRNGGRPLRCVVDPIFSMRCSPTQFAGPRRSYPPPCTIADLEEIDVVMISHNHYDHLDYDTVMEIWKQNKATVRFVVPLGNRVFFLEQCGIEADRVTELDWWDEARLTLGPIEQNSLGDASLTVTCTPAQHNSGRVGIEPNSTLWASWFLSYALPNRTPYRVFFAGDTGYQFHDSPGWPPSPPSPPETPNSLRSWPRKGPSTRSSTPNSNKTSSTTEKTPSKDWPACPAFREIAERLGCPDILLLPVSVGATYDYLRSMTYLPDSWNVIPRHSAGVTAHNHMPAWDAVRVFKDMTEGFQEESGKTPVAMAIHWGTFVTESAEVLKTLGQLMWACEAQGVKFARVEDCGLVGLEEAFFALNHGESIEI